MSRGLTYWQSWKMHSAVHLYIAAHCLNSSRAVNKTCGGLCCISSVMKPPPGLESGRTNMGLQVDTTRLACLPLHARQARSMPLAADWQHRKCLPCPCPCGELHPVL